MQVSAFIKKNDKFFLFICLVLSILLLIGCIYYISSSNTSGNQTLTTVGSNLKGYTEIKQEISNLLANAKTDMSSSIRSRIYQKFTILESKNSSPTQGYQAINQITIFISSTYSQTHNPQYRRIINDLDRFAKNNFSKQYNKNDFFTICQDSTCQDEPTPAQIVKIIDEINKSDMPDGVKNSLVLNLTNANYMTKNNRYDKFIVYNFVANQLKSYSIFSPSGANLTIANDLQNFLDVTYPQEKKTYSNSKPESAKTIKQNL